MTDVTSHVHHKFPVSFLLYIATKKTCQINQIITVNSSMNALISVTLQKKITLAHLACLCFFLDSNSPWKDLLFPRVPNLAQKPLYLLGTVLKWVLSWSFIHYLKLYCTLSFWSCHHIGNIRNACTTLRSIKDLAYKPGVVSYYIK